MDKFQILPLTLQLTCIAGCLWTKSLQCSRAARCEMLLLHEFYEKNYLFPDKYHKTELIDEENKEDEDDDDEMFLRGTSSGFSTSNKSYVPRVDSRSNIPIKPTVGWADVCMLEACRSYQSNYEIKQNGTFYGPLTYYINQVLLCCQLSSDISWIDLVKKKMDQNPKLSKQNMVIQTTNRQ
jgi:hypothetical protein